ncbi:MAG: heme lyase CcmF/NrfE family subunit [Chloroflexi bacterium]|nr:heme lyase CcmF/NrfE family subunit [Chloroflexota bacterium]
MPVFGFSAIQIALGLSVYGAIAAFWGAQRGRRDLIASARNAVYAVFGLVTLAIVTLWVLLLRSDFNVEYVAHYTNRELPTVYKLTALWGGNSGSLLFWLWLLALFMLIVTLQNVRRHPDLLPYVHSVMLVVAAFFSSVLVFLANPFATLNFTPADGQGLNPLLQNYWMAMHPPLLYTGYVGFTVPFAFAIAALLSKHTDARWLKATRAWVVVPWLALSIGIILGSQWAYQELGWGGYWGWDPVENASLMPWLAGTAFLHSVIIQERRNMMKVWNVVLIIVTFGLCLLGTFLTRSGIIQSVHAFANSPQSPYFLAFIGAVMLTSLALVARRWDQLRSEHELDSLLSREAAFVGNNLLLMGIAFAVFWGTIWPVVTEVVQNSRVTVTTPFFNRVNGPLLAGLILLMGLTMVLGWRRTTQTALVRGLIVPFLTALAIVVVLVWLGLRDSYALVGFGIIGFSTAATVRELHTGAAARRRATREPYPLALVNLISKGRRRYGGYLVHIAVFMIATGVVGSTMYQVEDEVTLRKGESRAVGPYTLTYQTLNAYSVQNKDVVEADLLIQENGGLVGTLSPNRFFYRKSDQPVTEAAIRTSLRDDLYVLLAGWDEKGDSITLKVFVNPLVVWIWLGGLCLLLGTLISAWPVTVMRVAAYDRAAVRAGQPARPG